MRSTIMVCIATTILLCTAASSSASVYQPSTAEVRKVAVKANVFAQAHNLRWALTLDRDGFQTVGHGRSQQTKTNSLVKAVALSAYLRMKANSRLSSYEKSQLSLMIRRSDNAAATRIINQLGKRRLQSAARAGGMTNFVPVTGRFWGASQITPASAAKFFLNLRSTLPARHRAWGYLLFRQIIAPQRWGMYNGIPKDAIIHFKSGWDGRGHVIQAAEIRCGVDRIGLSVVADSNSQTTSIHRLRKLTKIALEPWAGHCL